CGSLGAAVRYRVGEQRVTVSRAGAPDEVREDETVLAYLARELARLRTDSPQLPFDFNGGFVGYLGYEVRADCGGGPARQAELPDTWLLLADRLVAIDHELGEPH